ncbi:MAG: hypothetical protein KME08_17395 [Aphanothece sp. CMT-3BRIN-NPC111]|nr:hypothetical protein [Aphanothece sp. CMT-3BRIN-NPC111]
MSEFKKPKMKLRLLPVIFALVVPLAACNSGEKSSSSPNSVASPTSTSSPSVQGSPTTPTSPNASTSPSSGNVTGNWYSYSSSEGNYTVKFPGKPEEQKRAADSQQGSVSGVEVRYVDPASQRLYVTGHVNIPVPPGQKKSNLNVEQALNGGRDSIARTSGATIKNEKKITENGLSGREFTMTLPNGLAAKARIFINPDNFKAYQAIVAAKDGKVDIPEASTFLESLNINK